ncbi:MAG: uracil phosphoribosyltransferase [Planctomycetota bacterium]|jgi:uracil phosphoribosyltransferase
MNSDPEMTQPTVLERPLNHHYGERVHLLEDPWTRTALARLSSPGTGTAEMIPLVRALYHRLLFRALEDGLPSCVGQATSRMAELHPEGGVWNETLIDPSVRLVIVDVIRGGIVPAQVCFELLAALLPPESVRLDHLNMARVADASGTVIGADLSGSKIGGPVEGATLLFPDPMGATGSTMLTALEHYIEHHGRPSRVIAMPMICTPEFLRALLPRFDELRVVTGRIDRGLSDKDVLDSLPGAHWDRERGLDDRCYIVPGAGGVGELLNQSWC